MKKSVLYILFFLATMSLPAQTTIHGLIINKRGEKIPGANIYLKNTYEGSTSDLDGKFLITTNLTGKQTLIVSFIGFNIYEEEILPEGKEIYLEIVLYPNNAELGGVIITAGTFEASDEKKAVVLGPLDIVTTPGSEGDIIGALNKLPGTMKVGEEGKLFVRGGDSYETTTFIDGMPVQSAYSSSMPDVPSRSRFSPYLFSGTIFSTGGYSAEFGQALSSALILNSNDLPDNSFSSISLMSIGVGGSHTQRWEKTSLSALFEYYNLSSYYALIPQNIKWKNSPEGAAGNVVFRHKTSKNGLIKGFANFSNSCSILYYPDPLNINKDMSIGLKNNNLYVQGNYRDIVNDKLVTRSGISYEINNDETEPGNNNVKERNNSIQARHSITYLLSGQINIRGGLAISARKFSQDFRDNIENRTYSTTIDDRLYAGFLETEITVGHRFAVRIGGRYEYSGLLNSANLAPRISMAYKTGKYSQVSMAYGIFYQTPFDDYLRFNTSLRFEKATHYILNYQLMNDRRIFRVEAYYKLYDNLVKFEALHNPNPETYNNNGTGYARGIDVFFRDQKTFSNGDFWISYSYIDTERDYKNYPVSAIPTYVSNHNFSFVYKYWVQKISSQIGGAYSFSSGRTYYNPNHTDFLSDKTKPYHDVSLNISYLTEIFEKFTIIHLSASNVFGLNQVYQYRYQTVPGPDGFYPSYAVKPPAKRFWFLGIFISI